jgi:hypothetical protein
VSRGGLSSEKKMVVDSRESTMKRGSDEAAHLSVSNFAVRMTEMMRYWVL